ncbi:hypothetical protein JW964_09845 [candidate division KSB1 bacterium]|nr:hypothetical protein [candidate division KSB1 bacterium]
MLFPQKAVGLINRDLRITILAEKKVEIEVVGCPTSLKPITSTVRGQGKVNLLFATTALSYAHQIIKLKITDLETNDKQLVEIQSRVFGEKEFFICLVISSNIHYGWDPAATEQYRNRNEPNWTIFQDERQGKDAFVHTQHLEPVFHKWNTPITWLFDDTVAMKAINSLKNWYRQYGDDYGLLPRSYFHHNFRNYNTQISLAQTIEILTLLRDSVQEIFIENQFPYYTRIMGVDPWIGSIGTNFIKAAAEIGLEGIWGMGYDHHATNTSTYHRGAPWDVYKPLSTNFRVPGLQANPWLFQSSTRDILNAAYFSPNGAKIFGTDANELWQNLIHQFQPDYFARLALNYKKNLLYNDYFVFIVHQADHEAYRTETNQIFENFLDQVHPDNLFATMEEIVAWLNLKYQSNSHPSQILELEDSLTCHQQLRDAANPGLVSKELGAHPLWGNQPDLVHLAYYGLEHLWIARFPELIPFIYYDYTHCDRYTFSESGALPLEKLPQVLLIQQNWIKNNQKMRLELTLESDLEFNNLPWIIWNPPIILLSGRNEVMESAQGVTVYFRTSQALVLILNKVLPGKNVYWFQFEL